MPDPEDDGMVFELRLRRYWSEELGVTSCLTASFFFRINKRLLFTEESFSKDIDFFFFFGAEWILKGVTCSFPDSA